MRRKSFIERTKSSLLSGFYAVIILALIARYGPIYGYRIMKMIGEKSSGFFNPSESTIYTILGAMEKEGIIESFWALAGEKVPRKYYKLSDEGKEVLSELVEHVDRFLKALNDILKGEE